MGRGLSITAFILSLLFFVPFASLAGLILGIIGVVKAKKKEDLKGLAIAAIAVGAVFTLLGLLMVVGIFGLVGTVTEEMGPYMEDTNYCEEDADCVPYCGSECGNVFAAIEMAEDPRCMSLVNETGLTECGCVANQCAKV